MFSFFSSKPQQFPIGSILIADMHAHFLPGIDDGAADIEASILLLEGLKNIGFEYFVGTPHVMSDLYPNTPETIRQAADQLRLALDARGLNVNFAYSAEYLLDEGFSTLLNKGTLRPIRETKHVLVETAFLAEPPNLTHHLFDLQAKGYAPILAHPERYRYLHYNLQRATELKERGFILQSNILSFTGYYGKAEKDTAVKLLEAGLIDLLGTDIHHERHLRAISSYRLDRKVIKLMERYEFRNATLFTDK